MQTAINPRALAHRNDPDTSVIAAERHVASGANDSQCEKVHKCLCSYLGCTSAELADHCGLDRTMVARRLPDLVKRKLARQGGKRICEVTGSLSVTWWTAEGGEQ